MPSIHYLFTAGDSGSLVLPALPAGATHWFIVARIRGGRGGAPSSGDRRNLQQTWTQSTVVADPGPFTLTYVVGADASGKTGGWPNGGDGGDGDGASGDGFGGGGGSELQITSPANPGTSYGFAQVPGTGGWSGDPATGGTADEGDRRTYLGSFVVDTEASFGAVGLVAAGTALKGGNSTASGGIVGEPGPVGPLVPTFAEVVGGDPTDDVGGTGASAAAGSGGPGGGGGGGGSPLLLRLDQGGGGGGAQGTAGPYPVAFGGENYYMFGGGGRGEIFDEQIDLDTGQNLAPAVVVGSDPGGEIEITIVPLGQGHGWKVGHIGMRKAI